jgi:hypothetical protein
VVPDEGEKLRPVGRHASGPWAKRIRGSGISACSIYFSLLPLAHSLRNFARSSAMFFVSAINFPIESPPATPMTPTRRCWNVANVAPSADLTEPSTVTPDLPAPKPTT